MSATRELDGRVGCAATLALLEGKIEAIHRGELEVESDLGLPEDHPFALLSASITEMAEALRDAKEQRAAQEQALERQVYVIESQASAIAELSCPVIQLWPGVLTLPIIGTMTPDRATHMTRSLLEEVVRLDTELVIIDLTGVQELGVDGSDHILRMARCVGLLGSRCAISGVRPRVAQLIVELQSDLGAIRCFRTLRGALSDHVEASKLRARRRTRPRDPSAPQRQEDKER